MKIEGRKGFPLGPIGPLGTPAPAEQPRTETAPVADKVSLTSTQQLRRLNQAVSTMSDVRMEKVADLRGAIEDGSYHVESEKLARKMVDEALREGLQSRGA